MDASLNEKVKVSIQNLRDKKSRIYFLVQDTKGNAKASVRLIYQTAKSLLDSGFNPIILHEKNDYAGVVAWMDEEYIDMSSQVDDEDDETMSGSTEMKINIIKFEMVKMLMDTVLTENEDTDETLGSKSSSNTSIPFRLAFNSLLNKKLINYY